VGDQASIHFGTCAWAFDDWHGVFYPRHLPHPERLAFYARWFPAVESDSTFYHIPAPHVVEHWAEATPPGFRFSLKLPREITHERKLRDCAEPLAEFLRRVEHLGSKLGCLLVQLPPWFNPRHDEHALRDFLIRLPRAFRWAVEFREEEWRFPRIARLLEEHGIAWAWNDQTPLERANEAAFEFHPTTADFAVLRLLGDWRTRYLPDGSLAHDYCGIQWPRETSLENWAAKLKLERPRLKEVFVFGGNHFEGYAPATVERIARSLGEDISLPVADDLREPETSEQQQLWG
jgi:uncharacterized protein YecE (DUF72 family)